MAIEVGFRVKVLPAYSADTKRRTIRDDVTNLVGEVERIDARDALVWFKGHGEWWLPLERLRHV